MVNHHSNYHLGHFFPTTKHTNLRILVFLLKTDPLFFFTAFAHLEIWTHQKYYSKYIPTGVHFRQAQNPPLQTPSNPAFWSLVPYKSLDPPTEGWINLYSRGLYVLKKSHFWGVRILRVAFFGGNPLQRQFWPIPMTDPWDDHCIFPYICHKNPTIHAV